MTGDHYVSIHGQHLRQYCRSVGGGMIGGYCEETVKRYDDTHALITVETAERHDEDPEIREYFVDAAIMDELEDVIRKYRMNFWNRKKFTNLFISDGESESYRFSFDRGQIFFSSQFYPAQYSEKLEKFDEIIQKYLGCAEKG